MAISLIEVDTALLERDRLQMRERLNTVLASLRSIYADVAELDGMWEGPTNAAFNRQFAADREQFEAFCAQVNELIQNLEYAKAEYEKCEAQVQSAVAAVRI